jgi:hypothetical protein
MTAPTIENAEQIELFAPSEKLAGVAFEGRGFLCGSPAVGCCYLPPPRSVIPSCAALPITL